VSRRTDRLLARVARRDQRRQGGRVTYRHITRLAGPDPAPNPARIAGLVVNGNPLAGATTFGLRGTAMVGRFIAGDLLRIGDAILAVAADAVADNNAATVTITAGLPVGLADGAAVAVEWLNVRADVPAEIQGLGERIPDGTLVEMRDLFLTIAAGNLPWPPASGDEVALPGGDIRSVVVAQPIMEEGIAVTWRVQVR
jgi:hypothetical protein